LTCEHDGHAARGHGDQLRGADGRARAFYLGFSFVETGIDCNGEMMAEIVLRRG